MATQTITVDLPEDIFQRLAITAETLKQPVESILLQSVRGNLPPAMSDLPDQLRSELTAEFEHLDDQALWMIIQSSLPDDQWQRHEALLEKNQEERLSAEEQEELTRLRTDTDKFVLRRSYALAMLKWRGYTVPTSIGNGHD